MAPVLEWGCVMELLILACDQAKGRQMKQRALAALRHMHRHDPIRKVVDRAAIAHYPVVRQPCLLVDGDVVAEGFVPEASEIEAMLKARLGSRN